MVAQAPAVNFITAGQLLDRYDVSFAASFCGAGAQFEWDFGDPGSGTDNHATGASVTHQFDTDDQDRVYAVTLTVIDANGQRHTRRKDVRIQKERVEVVVCTNGIYRKDACGNNQPDRDSCTGGTPPSGNFTEFKADVPGNSCVFSYQWQQKTTDPNSVWTDMASSGTSGPVTYTGATSNTLHFNNPPHAYQRYRCVVRSSGCNRSSESQPVQVEYYSSNPGTTHCPFN